MRATPPKQAAPPSPIARPGQRSHWLTWCTGEDLNPSPALIPRKLLILRYAKLAQLAKAANLSYTFLTLRLLMRAMTRDSPPPLYFFTIALASQDAPSVTELFSPSQRQMMTFPEKVTYGTHVWGEPLPLRSCVIAVKGR
jgi:hypothetical protein